MKLIYCDESNLEAKSGDFLLYGGLTIDADQYLGLSNAIWDARDKYSIPKDEKLKYLPAPTNLSGSEYIGFKKECIQICIDFGCNFLVYQALHDVAKDTDLARRNGINEICLNFSHLLRQDETCGLILIDRFNDKGNMVDAHLVEKFSVGLVGFPDANPLTLDRVVGLHYSAIGQSHMPSMVDIVLGTYRTAVNIFARNHANKALANEILAFLEPLFRVSADGTCIPRMSISFSPQSVAVKKYREMYAAVIQCMESAGYSLTQDYKS